MSEEQLEGFAQRFRAAPPPPPVTDLVTTAQGEPIFGRAYEAIIVESVRA